MLRTKETDAPLFCFTTQTRIDCADYDKAPLKRKYLSFETTQGVYVLKPGVAWMSGVHSLDFSTDSKSKWAPSWATLEGETSCPNWKCGLDQHSPCACAEYSQALHIIMTHVEKVLSCLYFNDLCMAASCLYLKAYPSRMSKDVRNVQCNWLESAELIYHTKSCW